MNSRLSEAPMMLQLVQLWVVLSCLAKDAVPARQPAVERQIHRQPGWGVEEGLCGNRW